MYRFRSIDSLLGKFRELENQEIYFASPEELNDPMEGYKDVLWNGDKIVWKNFIINYIKSVEHQFTLTILYKENEKIDDSQILESPHRKIYHTPQHQKLIQQIISTAFQNKFINGLPEALSKRAHPIKRSELLSYLQILHPLVVNAVSETLYKTGTTKKRLFHQNIDHLSNALTESVYLTGAVDDIEKKGPNGKSFADVFFSVINLQFQQTQLIAKYNLSEQVDLTSNGYFLVSEFPEKYVSRLESSIYPDWYSASFLDHCDNSAIWGHYGDNHNGVCLKFKTYNEDNKNVLKLQMIYSYSSSPNYSSVALEGMRPVEFHKVQYHNRHVEIDFFRSLARMNKAQLNAFWYSDDNGNFSSCCDHFFDEKKEEDWRNQYWENFKNNLSIKLSEWKYEQEYRLIIHGDFHDYSIPEKRKFKYDFNDLEAIIFGIKTSSSDKIRIMRIIENKCRQHNRKTFDFYQAYYSKETGKILTSKLDLVTLDGMQTN